MKDPSELFFNIYSNYSFYMEHMFLGRINTILYTKLLPQYQTDENCAVPIKPIFHHLEKVKGKICGWGWGGSTSTLDDVQK